MAIKADRSFFCKLAVIAHMRGLDLYEVYSHELGPILWSIATAQGTLYKAKKALLLDDLEKDIPNIQAAPPDAVWMLSLTYKH